MQRKSLQIAKFSCATATWWFPWTRSECTTVPVVAQSTTVVQPSAYYLKLFVARKFSRHPLTKFIVRTVYLWWAADSWISDTWQLLWWTGRAREAAPGPAQVQCACVSYTAPLLVSRLLFTTSTVRNYRKNSPEFYLYGVFDFIPVILYELFCTVRGYCTLKISYCVQACKLLALVWCAAHITYRAWSSLSNFTCTRTGRSRIIVPFYCPL